MEMSLKKNDLIGRSFKNGLREADVSRKRSLKDWAAGLALIMVGGAFSAVAWRYDLGSVSQMGPGFVPFVLGLFLVGLGVADLVRTGLKAETPVEGRPINWRGICCISGALLAFALLIGTLGFVPAVFSGTMLTNLAESPIRWTRALVYSCVFTAAGYGVFILGLGLPVPVFGW
jgi:hypothetical protein